MKTLYIVLALLLLSIESFAGGLPGLDGITGATSDFKLIFPSVGTLAMAIGGIVGIAGGARIYYKWNAGDEGHLDRDIIGWFGACIFLVLVGGVMKVMFQM